MTDNAVTRADRQGVVALVLAAGSSKRLGRPKQLLAYRNSTLLGTTLDTVRSFGFDKQIVTLGGNAAEVRNTVDLDGFDAIHSTNPTAGCSSSIVTALASIDPSARGIMLFLGDQPHVDTHAVTGLMNASADSAIAVCRYDDGIGHPFWFSSETFGELAQLHGDKAVWKVIESGRHQVREVRIARTIPLDVDTEDDYQRLLADAS